VGEEAAAEGEEDEEHDRWLARRAPPADGPELWAAILRGEDADSLARAEEDAALASLREQLAREAAEEDDGDGEEAEEAPEPPPAGTSRRGLAAWALLSADLRALTGCADPALAAARAPPALLARMPSLPRAAPQLRRWAREADALAQHRAARVRRLAAQAQQQEQRRRQQQLEEEEGGVLDDEDGGGDEAAGNPGDPLAAYPRLLRAVEAAEAAARGELGGWSARQRAALAAADGALAEAGRRGASSGLQTPEAAVRAVVSGIGGGAVGARLFGSGPAGGSRLLAGAGGGRLLPAGRRAGRQGAADDAEADEEEEEEAEEGRASRQEQQQALERCLAALREAARAAAAAEEEEEGDDDRALREAAEQRLRLLERKAAPLALPAAAAASLAPAVTAAAARRVQHLLKRTR
jgi:hypothetical protein